MSDFSQSRSNYLKIMNGNLRDKVASVNSQNTINNVGDTSFDSMEVSSMLNNFKTDSLVKQANNTIQSMSTPEENKERSWYQSIHDTATNLAYGIQDGFLGFFDSIGDLFFNTTIELGKQFNWDTTWAETARDYDWQAQAIKGMNILNPTNLWTGDMFTSDYWTDWDSESIREDMNNIYTNSLLEKINPNLNKFTYGLANTFGNMIPSIVMGQVGLGVGSNLASQGIKTAFSPQTMSQIFSLGTMGAGAFASKTNEAYEESGNFGKAVGAGIASASVEVLSEIFVGKALEGIGIGNGKVMGIFGGEKAVSPTGASIIKDIAKSFNEEGMEEVVSGLMEPLIDSIYKGTDAFKSEEGKANRYLDTSFWLSGDDSILQQYIAGGAMGGLGDAISSVHSNKTFSKNGAKAIRLMETNAELASEYNKTTDSTKKAQLQEQIATNATQIALLSKQVQETANVDQKANFLEALTNPTEFQTVSQKTQQEQQQFLETRIKEYSDVNKIGTRNLFNDIEGHFGKGVTLEFDELSDDVNGKFDSKTKTITLNTKFAEKHAGTLVHEYFGHAIGDGLTSSQVNSMFNKVIGTSWYETNGKALRDAYRGKNFKQEVVNKYIEGVFDTNSKVRDVFTENTLLKRLNAYFDKQSNLNILRNNAIAKEFVKSIDTLMKNNVLLQKVTRKIIDGKKLTTKEKEYLEEFGDIIEAYQQAKESVENSKKVKEETKETSKEETTETKEENKKISFEKKDISKIKSSEIKIAFASEQDRTKINELKSIRGKVIDENIAITKDSGKYAIQDIKTGSLIKSYKAKSYQDAYNQFIDDKVVQERYSNYVNTKQYKDLVKAFDEFNGKSSQVEQKASKKVENKIDNSNEQVENEIKEGGRSNEFRKLQETSRAMSSEEQQSYHTGSKIIDEGIRERLSRVLGREIKSRSNSSRNGKTSLVNPKANNTLVIHNNVEASLFRDCFEIVQNYLLNGDCVDVHGLVSTEYETGYNDCKCYLSEDGLSGFAITKNGDLISVFNLGTRGFLQTIKEHVYNEGARTLDCYNSKKQPLADIYAKTLGFTAASVMDFNYDILVESKGKNYADYFVNTYGEAPVAFMVNTTNEVETKHFNKNQYDDAYNYQQEVLNNKQVNQEEIKTEVVGKQNKKQQDDLKPYETNNARGVEDSTEDKLGKKVNLKTAEDVYNYTEKFISDALSKDFIKGFAIKNKNGKARRLFEEYNISKNGAKRNNIDKFVNDILKQNVYDNNTIDEQGKKISYSLEQYLTDKGIDSKTFAKELGDTMFTLLSLKAVDTKAQMKLNKLKGYFDALTKAKVELQETNKLMKKLYNIKTNLQKAMESKVGATGQMHLSQGVADMFNKFFSKLNFTTQGYTSITNLKNLKEMVDNGTFNNMVETLLNKNTGVELTKDQENFLNQIKEEAKLLADQYDEKSNQTHLSYSQTIELRDLCGDIYKAYKDYSVAVKENARKEAQTLVDAVTEVNAKRWNLNDKARRGLKIMLNYMSPKQFYGYVFGGTDTEAFKKVWNETIVNSYDRQLGKFVDFLKARDEFIKTISKKRYDKVTLESGKKIKRYALYQFYLNTLSPDNDIRMKNGGIMYTESTTTKLSYEEMESALSQLSPKELSDLDGIFNLYNTTLKDYLGEISLRNFGFKNEGRMNYYPISISDITRNSDYTSGNSINPNPNAVTNNHFKGLTNNMTVIELNVDPMELYEKYVQSMTITGEIGLASQKLNRLWNLKTKNGQTLKQVASQYTPDIDEFINYSMKQLLGYANAQSSRALSFLMGNYATAKLALNQRSVLKQFASFGTAMGQLGFWKSMKAILNPKAFAQLKANREKIKNNNIYKMRVYENGAIRAATFGHQFSSTVAQKMAKIGLWGMETTDRFTCLLTYSLARATVLTDPNNANLKAEQIDKLANDTFTNLILDTQSNADRIVMSRVRSGDLGAIPKYLFGMFGSDAQNKAGQFFEATNNLINANRSKDKARIDLAKKHLGSVGAGLIVSGLIATLADLLADWLYDKEDPEDFNIVSRSIEMANNTLVDWIPYVSSMINWYKYDGANIGGLQLVNDVLDTTKSLVNGGFQNKNFRTKTIIKLGELLGFPLGNIEKLVKGTLGNFNPELALKYKNLLYGLSQAQLSTQATNYINNGKMSRAIAPISLNYSLYKFSIDDNTAKEIANLKKAGTSVSIKNVPETIGETTLTQEQRQVFATYYSQASSEVSKMISDINYQKLDSTGKAKALNKISDIYYEIATSKALGTTDNMSKLAKIIEALQHQFDYQKVVAAMVLAQTSDNPVQAVNNTQGLTRVEKLLALRLANKKITSENKDKVNAYLRKLGMSKSAIENLW